MATGTEQADLLINDGSSPAYESIDARGGDDEIRVRGDAPQRVVDVDGGQGNDLLWVYAPGYVVSSVVAGSGGTIILTPNAYDENPTDPITINYVNIERVKITGQLGWDSDSIVTGDTADILDLVGLDRHVWFDVFTGAGHDEVTISTQSNAWVDLGAGNDRLHADAGNYERKDGVVAYGGAGDDLLVGGSYHDELHGGDGADILYGGSGRDDLYGGFGADTMVGGHGDDSYFVDNVRDIVTESAGGGRDLVTSSLDFVLPAEVEYLTLTGAAIRGTGNDLANVITGNAAANWLDGGAGADQLIGGAGDDIYTVDDIGDRVIETAAADGIDTVRSSISYTLPGLVENLTLIGSAAIDGFGNAGANVLIGNVAANLLDGRAGADRMAGGPGDDIYIVEDPGDRVVERAGEGTDTVRSKISYELDYHLENLELIGNAPIDGTGNKRDNVLTGNGSDNMLRGAAGDDTLFGGGGRDRLYGGAGDDAIDGGNGNDQLHGGEGADSLTGGAGLDGFWFDLPLAAAGVDRLLDFTSADDTIYLDRNVFSAISKGVLGASAFQLGAAALDADDRILYDAATGRILYDADGAGGTDAVLFATVAANTPVTHLDFVGV